MLQFVVVLALAVMCATKKTTDLGSSTWTSSSDLIGGSSWPMSPGSLEIRSPLPVEVAPEEMTATFGSESLVYPAPAVDAGAPIINLPKEAQEVVDVPQADIRLPGNSLENKDLHLTLPSPVVEARKPIIREKEVLFRLPQPIFYLPKPNVQHKPIVYKVPHTLHTITPRVSLSENLFKVPSAQITGKSSYIQPMCH